MDVTQIANTLVVRVNAENAADSKMGWDRKLERH
jgi:hypothetical protein